jgi:hypothetical protein
LDNYCEIKDNKFLPPFKANLYTHFTESNTFDDLFGSGRSLILPQIGFHLNNLFLRGRIRDDTGFKGGQGGKEAAAIQLNDSEK